MTDPPPTPPPARLPAWRLAAGLLIVLAVIIGLRATREAQAPQPRDPESNGADATAELVIDPLAGGTPSFVLPVGEGETALSLLEAAADEHGFAIDRRGEGPMAFVDAIGGVQNEGAAGKNWQFWLNDERSNVGAGAAPVSPGDRVLWRLAPYE